MGKRGRRRRDDAGSESVKMMKLESRLNAASSLQAALSVSPPPVKLFSSTFFCVHILLFWFRENKGFLW